MRFYIAPTEGTIDILERIAEMPFRVILKYVLFARFLDIGTATLFFLAYPLAFVKAESNLAFVDLVTKGDYFWFLYKEIIFTGVTLGILVVVRHWTNTTSRSFRGPEDVLIYWSSALFVFGFLVFFSIFGALSNIVGLLGSAVASVAGMAH